VVLFLGILLFSFIPSVAGLRVICHNELLNTYKHIVLGLAVAVIESMGPSHIKN